MHTVKKTAKYAFVPSAVGWIIKIEIAVHQKIVAASGMCGLRKREYVVDSRYIIKKPIVNFGIKTIVQANPIAKRNIKSIALWVLFIFPLGRALLGCPTASFSASTQSLNAYE
jgi:hypothetical protein